MPKRPSGVVPLLMSLGEATEAITKLYKKGGRSLSKAQLASEMGYSPSSSGYVMRISCLRQHGLAEERNGMIELSTLGLQIVAPTDLSAEASAKREALLRVPLYQFLHEKYVNKILPDKSDIGNVLFHEKKVDKDTALVWATKFLESVKAADLVDEGGGKAILLERSHKRGSENTNSTLSQEASPEEKPVPKTNLQQVHIPFGNGRYASFPHDLMSSEVDILTGILEVYRKGTKKIS